jgi:hypothetical protein
MKHGKDRKVVRAMDESGSHNDGWYPHDGEGKNMCTGRGCNCDEKNYGHHSSSSNGSPSTFGAILSVVGGLIGTAIILGVIGVDVENVPVIVIIILWAVVSAILAAIASKLGL